MDPLRKSTDRGATPYFHGRKPILDSFEKRLVDDKEKKEGTIFLVQGPPGIGKSALLNECRKKAKRKKWEVRKLVVPALWDPDLMAECLGLKKKESTTEKTVEGGGEISTGVAKFKGAVSGTTKKSTPKVTPRSLIQKIKNPLLLILDEAQHLGEDGGPPKEHLHAVKALLTEIHNGELGKPVILLAGGLGLTEDAFRTLGISRIAAQCKFDMKPLEEEEERQVIKNWLKKAGKAKGDTTEWTDAITTETVQWPRHVDSYARNAARLIKDNHGQMTEDLLRSVMEEGREERMEYYRGRTENLTYNEFCGLAELFQHVSLEIGLTDEQIKRAIGEAGFERSLSRGVLYKKGLRYSIPIPSLRDYMVREWLVEKEHVAQEQAWSKPPPEVDTEKEGPQKEAGNHTPDSPSPEKEEGKEPTIRKSEKDNSRQEPPPGRDPSNSDRDTDMGMER